jgi:hypothetical protein
MRAFGVQVKLHGQLAGLSDSTQHRRFRFFSGFMDCQMVGSPRGIKAPPTTA